MQSDSDKLGLQLYRVFMGKFYYTLTTNLVITLAILSFVFLRICVSIPVTLFSSYVFILSVSTCYFFSFISQFHFLNCLFNLDYSYLTLNPLRQFDLCSTKFTTFSICSSLSLFNLVFFLNPSFLLH